MAMSQARKSLVTMLLSLVLAGGVGAYAYYGVYKGEEAEKKSEEKEAKIFEFDKEKVVSLSLQSKGMTSKFDKVGDTWQLTSPVQARADKAAIQAIIDKFADLKAKNLNEDSKGKLPPQYLVSDSAADVQKYGFDQPQWSAGIVLSDGKQYSLQVGAESSYDRSLYFRRADESRVYVADSGLKHPLDKTLFDLRDKAIVTHEDKDVVAVAVEGNGSAWSAERDGEGWKITSPVQDNGDKQTIEGLLNRIHSVRAKSFPAESLDPKDAEKYGFTRPLAQVTYFVGADKTKKVLVIGEAAAEGGKKGYAHLVEGGPVEEIDPGLAKDILKTPNELRDRTIISFARDRVARITVTPASDPKFVITHTKEKAAGATNETDKFALEGRTEKLKTWKVSSALHALSNMKGAALVEDNVRDLSQYGLDKPQWTYSVALDNNQEEQVLVGSTTGTRYYVKTGKGTRVYEVEKATINELPKTADEILDVPPPAPKEPAASTEPVQK